jgi:polyferredoxin
LILGFWFAVPLSLGKINSFLMGYMPEWQTGIYWYLILTGFIIPILFAGKNIYCNRICPFGALQECLGQIGRAKYRITRKWMIYLRWFQRFLAWIAICLALYSQNPVQLNYQIFGVVFTLSGAIYLFAFMFLFIIVALFIRRPYCTVLCPINAIAELMYMTRKWFMEYFFHQMKQSNPKLPE